MNTPYVGTFRSVSSPMTTPSGWTWALLAIVAPTLIAAHDPPSVTFYNQVTAVIGWGLLLAWLGQLPVTGPLPSKDTDRSGMWALTGLCAILSVAAMWSTAFGHLPIGLALMGGGLSLAALLTVWVAWRQANSADADTAKELFFGALAVAGAVGLVLAAIQVFWPELTDGTFIAKSTMAGRAIGNLRQPNHFSTLLVFAACAFVWLGARQRLSVGTSAIMVSLCIAGIVLTASRTGMVAMVLLTLWGCLDRRLPRSLRWTLIAAPAIYGLWWGAMWALAHLDTSVAFAAETRMHDGSDISSSRFSIWSNVLSLIAQHPWYGVGYGEFNLAWTLTPFPNRPTAFFDHTHNIVLQWAVELGLPLAITLTLLALWALWSMVRPQRDKTHAGDTVAVGAAAVIVATAGLHSLLEYPLWYTYFLLPTAFAWGLGLGSRTHPATADRPPRTIWMGAGLCMAFMGGWCALDYQFAANVYSPRLGSAPLAQRIAMSQPMPWWGYQADYADVTARDEDAPQPTPSEFKRTLHNLMDARLMIAYANALAQHGDVDKARHVAARLREFHNPSAKAFFTVCEDVPTPAAPPYQCQTPERAYTWQELLP